MLKITPIEAGKTAPVATNKRCGRRLHESKAWNTGLNIPGTKKGLFERQI